MSAVLGPNGQLAFPQPPISPLRELRPATTTTLARPVPLQPPAANRSTGLIVVVVFHVLLGWALASGLARKAVEMVKKPIEMVIVPQDLPPPPPKIEKIKDLPKPDVPPPAYVPPPEVVPVTPPPAPVIQAVQQVAPPPAPPVIAPPPAPPVEPPKPAVVKQEVAVACPGYQAALAGVLEEAFDRVGQPGTVQLLLKIKGGRVIEAVPQSGPKEYFNILPGAIKRSMRCTANGDAEVQATLPVVFQR